MHICLPNTTMGINCRRYRIETGMKSMRLLMLILFTAGCISKDTNLFSELTDKKDVVIALSDYGLDSIPLEIGKLKKAETLTISQDSLKGWTIFPALFALDERIDLPPRKTLPDEITELKNLRRLTISGLNIKSLPPDFDKLQNLEYLSLVFNKLIISNELEKLKALKKLKYVYLVGNRIDTTEVERWQRERPDMEIKYGMD
jgi:hypothetical protein